MYNYENFCIQRYYNKWKKYGTLSQNHEKQLEYRLNLKKKEKEGREERWEEERKESKEERRERDRERWGRERRSDHIHSHFQLGNHNWTMWKLSSGC